MNFPDEATQFGDLAPHYDELMDVVPYNAWVDYIELLLSLYSHEPQRVLDCACGTGNVSFEMALRGWHIVGVDISVPMIEVAQQKVRETLIASDLTFYADDLTTFDLGEKFDTVTCLYDSLNYILEPEKLQAAFEHIRAHTEDYGLFIFDMNSDWAFEADLFTQRNMDARRDLNYDWTANYDADSRICNVQMTFRRKDENGATENFYETHRERAYTLSEVKTLLANSGWKLLRSFDAYTLNPPHKNSERWYFVARPA